MTRLIERGREYQGREVTTAGTVRAFAEGSSPYYVLEDDDQNRVGLLPGDVARRHVSHRVRVTGTYDFDPRRGRFIRAVRVEPLPARAP